MWPNMPHTHTLSLSLFSFPFLLFSSPRGCCFVTATIDTDDHSPFGFPLPFSPSLTPSHSLFLFYSLSPPSPSISLFISFWGGQVQSTGKVAHRSSHTRGVGPEDIKVAGVSSIRRQMSLLIVVAACDKVAVGRCSTVVFQPLSPLVLGVNPLI